MGAKSDYLESNIINHNFGGTAFAQPTEWWINVYSSDPTDVVDENTTVPLAPARIEIDSWTIVANEASNTNNVQFAAVPATETWVVSHYVIWDAETTGNALYKGQFRITKTLEEADVLNIAPNQLKIQEI